jgi:hypothetical protein
MKSTAERLQDEFDALVSSAAGAEREADLVAAKARFFQLTGEVYEDDKQFEARMAAFLEYYTLDRPQPGTARTPALERFEQALREGPPERAALLRAFTLTRHGLFEVLRLEPGAVWLLEPFAQTQTRVTERRALAGLSPGDLLEARLIPFGGQQWFTKAFCCHPRQVAPVIHREVARRRKSADPLAAQRLMEECAQRSLKADRYRNIALEKIYEFATSVRDGAH